MTIYIWIGFGAALGAGIGLLFDQTGIGIALGAAFGLLVGHHTRPGKSS